MQDTRNSSERLAAAKSGLESMAEEASRAWRQLAQARQICDSQLMRAPIAKPVQPSALGLLALVVGGAALGLVLGGKRRACEAQRAAFDATIAGQVSWVGSVERYEQAIKATVAEMTSQQPVSLAAADVSQQLHANRLDAADSPSADLSEPMLLCQALEESIFRIRQRKPQLGQGAAQ